MAANRRTVMTLYSDHSEVKCHYVRILLAEKAVPYELIKLDAQTKARHEELCEINPYGGTPTLVDRELTIYDANIIAEYLDERFPHPPLMPVYPVARAKARLIIYRFDRDWLPLIKKMESGKANEAKLASKEMTHYLSQLAPLFNMNSYFLGEEYSIVDCYMATILWRLPQWGITFSQKDAKDITKYSDKLFKRDAFQASLTEMELEQRKFGQTDTDIVA